MKSIRMCSLFLLLSLTGVACVVNPSLRMPSAEEIGARFQDQVQVNELERGRAIAITDCAECHRQYWPVEYSAKRWPGILEEMGDRASLSSADLEAVIAYMTHASEVAKNSSFD